MWNSPQVAGYVCLAGICIFLVFGQIYSVKLRTSRNPFRAAGLNYEQRASIQAVINSGRLPEDPFLKSTAIAWIEWNATTAARGLWLTIPMGIGFQMALCGLYATIVPAGVVVAIQSVVLVSQVTTFALYVRGSRKTKKMYTPDPTAADVGRVDS